NRGPLLAIRPAEPLPARARPAHNRGVDGEADRRGFRAAVRRRRRTHGAVAGALMAHRNRHHRAACRLGHRRRRVACGRRDRDVPAAADLRQLQRGHHAVVGHRMRHIGVLAGLYSLVSMEPRKALILAGAGVTAVGTAITIHGFQYRGFTFAVAGLACVYAAAPARAAGALAASNIVNAMRTEEMREMGDAWMRMRS